MSTVAFLLVGLGMILGGVPLYHLGKYVESKKKK